LWVCVWVSLTERDIYRDRQRQTDSDRQRQTETDRDRKSFMSILVKVTFDFT
jgi:hypothetical protein